MKSGGKVFFSSPIHDPQYSLFASMVLRRFTVRFAFYFHLYCDGGFF